MGQTVAAGISQLHVSDRGMLCVELRSTIEGWSTIEPGSPFSSEFAGTWQSSAEPPDKPVGGQIQLNNY